MSIYVDFNNLCIAVCQEHRHLADERGWSFLEWRQRLDDWPCYFAEVS